MSASFNASWLPDEPSDLLFLERANLTGQTLTSIGYGILISISFSTFYFLLQNRSKGKLPWMQIIYLAVLTAGSTIYHGAETKWIQAMFIDQRNYPGGPALFFLTDFSIWVNTFANSVYCFNNLLADGLMLYRCLLIWEFNWKIIVIPTLWLITSTIFSVITVWQSALPTSGLFATSTVNFGLTYFSLSISLNVVLTLLIVGRLYYARRNVAGILGKEHTRVYLSISAMVVESAAIYSIVGIIFIVPFGLNNAVAPMILPLLAQAMCISPALIILRVAFGHGISKGTLNATQTTATSKPTWARGPMTSSIAGSGLSSNGRKAVDTQATVVEIPLYEMAKADCIRLHEDL